MKIAFDVHGVIQNYPSIFKPIMEALRSMGNTVVIISGPPKRFLEEELYELGYEHGVHFDKIYSVVDFLHSISLVDPSVVMKQDDRGRWWTDDLHWWSSKARICKHNSVDLLIDDSIQYKPHFDDGCKFLLLTNHELERLFCIILETLER